MYFPYFRGKQNELITIRESAEILSQANFIPIIEPVKESLKGLHRAIEAITEADGSAILIVNPSYGDHIVNSEAIEELFENILKNPDKYTFTTIRKYLTDNTVIKENKR